MTRLISYDKIKKNVFFVAVLATIFLGGGIPIICCCCCFAGMEPRLTFIMSDYKETICKISRSDLFTKF